MSERELSALLDRTRDDLLQLPGVAGVGVGPASPEDPSAPAVIQVFVDSMDAEESVGDAAREIVGSDRVSVLPVGPMRPLGDDAG